MADSDGRHRRQVGKCEELRFRGDGACFAWRKATVDEIVEHFEYVECQIVRKETGDEQRKTMKLSLNINDDDNDDVFCYCNGIESFKQLAEYGMGEFIVTFCWSFF